MGGAHLQLDMRYPRPHDSPPPVTATSARVESSSDVPIDALEMGVRTTVALDDDLVREAQRLTGTGEKSALIRQALQALIERESARRLAQLAGSEPELRDIPRRRTRPA